MAAATYSAGILFLVGTFLAALWVVATVNEWTDNTFVLVMAFGLVVVVSILLVSYVLPDAVSDAVSDDLSQMFDLEPDEGEACDEPGELVTDDEGNTFVCQ